MSEDYYKTLIKDIIENNNKEEATNIIANKLNEKQISNEKEMLTNLEKDKEIERLNNIIKEVRETLKNDDVVVAIKITNGKDEKLLSSKDMILEILDKGSDKE